jgi:hypothetical protein
MKDGVNVAEKYAATKTVAGAARLDLSAMTAVVFSGVFSAEFSAKRMDRRRIKL